MLSWPNRITILRLLLVTPFVLLLLSAAEGPWYRYGALALGTLIGIGDAVDGILARRSGNISKLGSVLDPVADKALMLSAIVILAMPDVLHHDQVRDLHLPTWVAVTLVSRDLFILLGALIIYLLTGVIEGMPSVTGKAATVLQFTMLALVVASPDLVLLWPHAWPIVMHVIWGLTVLVAVVSLLGYIRMGSKLIASHGHGHS